MNETEFNEFECGRDELQVGDIVSIANCPHEGAIAMVYEVYVDFDDRTKKAVSLITSYGRDLGGWSMRDQKDFLKLAARTNFDYRFKNVLQLSEDYRNGLFGMYFQQYFLLSAYVWTIWKKLPS